MANVFLTTLNCRPALFKWVIVTIPYPCMRKSSLLKILIKQKNIINETDHSLSNAV